MGIGPGCSFPAPAGHRQQPPSQGSRLTEMNEIPLAESLGSPPEQAQTVLSAKSVRRQCLWALGKGDFGYLLGICIPLTPREAMIPSQVLRQSPPSPSHIEIFRLEPVVFVSESGVGGKGS